MMMMMVISSREMCQGNEMGGWCLAIFTLKENDVSVSGCSGIT